MASNAEYDYILVAMTNRREWKTVTDWAKVAQVNPQRITMKGLQARVDSKWDHLHVLERKRSSSNRSADTMIRLTKLPGQVVPMVEIDDTVIDETEPRLENSSADLPAVECISDVHTTTYISKAVLQAVVAEVQELETRNAELDIRVQRQHQYDELIAKRDQLRVEVDQKLAILQQHKRK
jgi:hypothetical protein